MRRLSKAPFFCDRYRRRLIGLSLTWVFLSLVFSDYPSRPIKVIVPTDPGGSMDMVARIISRTIEEAQLLNTKLVVINQPGAGGTIGTRRIRNADPDGYTIGLWHQGLVTSKAMKIVDYDHTAFEIIGSIGYSETGIGTGPRSDIKQYSDLMQRSKSGPIKFATNIGLPVHIVPMIFAQESGVDFQFIQVGGGSQRLSSILGGHTELGIFSSLDFSNFYEAGIRPIMFFSSERIPQYPDTPTAAELGIKFRYHTLYIWIAPLEIPKSVKETLQIALEQASENERVVDYLQSLGLTPRFQLGDEIESELNDIRDRAAPLIEQMRR